METLKADSWKMFNRIARRYDMLNSILSFGLHKSWRKRIGRFFTRNENQVLLDLATGTADVPIILVKHFPEISKAIGIDLAKEMLTIGENKIAKFRLREKISLSEGDARQIPFNEDSFDAVTMSFGIRNVEDPLIVMREMYRVLKRGGRALILEFSMPAIFFIRVFYLFYLRYAVPGLGFLLTGDYEAYKYLNHSVEKFPCGSVFCDMFSEAGFVNVKAVPVLFGVATIYLGDKD